MLYKFHKSFALAPMFAFTSAPMFAFTSAPMFTFTLAPMFAIVWEETGVPGRNPLV